MTTVTIEMTNRTIGSEDEENGIDCSIFFGIHSKESKQKAREKISERTFVIVAIK